MAEPTTSAAQKNSRTKPPDSAASGGGGSSTPAAPQFVPENDVHLLDRLAVLYRYRRLCVTVFVLVTAAMIIQGYSNIQIYVAQARILIEDERSTAIPGLQNDSNTYYEDPEPYYQTQYKILKGRDLTRRVVNRLHLEKVPEFNGTKPPPPTPISMLRDLRTKLIGYVKRAPETPAEAPKVDETTGRVGAGGVVHRARRRRPGPRQPSGRRDVHGRGSEVRGRSGEHPRRRVRQREPGDQAQVDAGHDRLAHQGAREPAEAGRGKRKGARRVSREGKRALARRQAEHRALAAQSAQRRGDQGPHRARAEGIALQPGEVDLERHRPDAIPIIAQNPTVQDRKGKLAELQREKVKLLERYGERHPQVVNINATLSDAQRQLDLELSMAVQSVRNEYETALLEERTLSKNLEGPRPKRPISTARGSATA
jgi:uncharacterized protein involved in exopolysaccharide biosynthesis